MNTYENEMMAMLRQGMSCDEVMNKMRTQLANAQAQIHAEEEEAKRQAEEKRVAEAKAKQLQAEKEARGTIIVDIANRALDGTLTAEDVAADMAVADRKSAFFPLGICVFRGFVKPKSVSHTCFLCHRKFSCSSF